MTLDERYTTTIFDAFDVLPINVNRKSVMICQTEKLGFIQFDSACLHDSMRKQADTISIVVVFDKIWRSNLNLSLPFGLHE